MTTPSPTLHPSVHERLSRLAPDQRAAAMAPPGPILCVAPAGSGKTTTLVARICYLIATGIDPRTIAAITFNTRAARELDDRLTAAVAPLGIDPEVVRVRTFHALGREILLDAGIPVDNVADRAETLRLVMPTIDRATIRRLDDAFSRLKLDLGLTASDVAVDPMPGPVARAFLAYEAELAASGQLDFDDLVVRAVRCLETDPALVARWRARCAHLLVDEVQDVDRCQLGLAFLLAAPRNRIFLVGDDDQSIYGWRLADVRRVLELAGALPGLRRVDLVTNYRCPEPVVARAVRLVSVNRERFVKDIRPGPRAIGRLVLAPDGSDDWQRVRRILASFGPEDGTTRAVLARTNRELLPVAAAALELGVRFRAPGLTLLIESGMLDDVLVAAGTTSAALPVLVRLRRAVGALVASGEGAAPAGDDDPATDVRLVGRAALGWAARYGSLDTLAAAIAEMRLRLTSLRTDDAPLTLATAHGTKGLEFDHVAVIGMDDGRFPSARSVGEAAEPDRALEEERRLAYVAWTRARRTLVLSYDPAAPSQFLLEAFSPTELGLTQAA